MNHQRILLVLIAMMIRVVAGAQVTSVTISGLVKSKTERSPIPYVNVVVKQERDSAFVAGTLTNSEGRFALENIRPGNYVLVVSVLGFTNQIRPLFVGSLSAFLDIPAIELDESSTALRGVTVSGAGLADGKLDRKTYSVADNIGQIGGSVLQAMQNLPGVTVQDGKVQLRGSDKVAVLIDGKQTAMTGFGAQAGLDNIPSSAIEKIEIINSPSARYDANGSAGIINIVMKKNRKDGFNGKVGLTLGLGSLWVRKENLPTIRPQYTTTPKINPSLAANYRKHRVNLFLQADNLYTQTLNKNEFVTRHYDDGTVISSQLKRNRNTNFLTTKGGLDWNIDEHNTLTVSGMYGSEKIIDRGDQPFFNGDISQRLRLWQFLEDELKTTAMATASYQHRFKEAGHMLNVGFNYTFHREDEKYFYDNYLPTSSGNDAFKLLSDEQVYDFNIDYTRPLRYGRVEAGIKLRDRRIPTDMQFRPGPNSVLDSDAGGWADYSELIPAAYGNYVLENKTWEAELGLRMEYVKIRYDVNPGHPTYKSDGYHYAEPFPNMRIAYKLSDRSRISVFYNRKVDRPNEVDIRIFPKYDDAEIIKVGNPALRPQFTSSLEMGYKHSWTTGSCYAALYHRMTNGTITRISSTVPGSTLIYAVFQNAGRSTNTGIEAVLNQKFSSVYTTNITGNLYRNQIDGFTVESLYPQPNIFTAGRQSTLSGNIKLNNMFRLNTGYEAQLTCVYLAPDVVPQGKIASRFSVDVGIKKSVQEGKGELFLNATDLLNTMSIRKQITGMGFSYSSSDYYETQVIRLGYSYKF